MSHFISSMVALTQSDFARKVVAIAILLGLILGQPLPTAAQEPPPALLSVTPADGSIWNGETITWSFDRTVAMLDAAVSPEIAGEWLVADEVVTFRPSAPPQAAIRYHFRFDAVAHNGEGEPAGDAPRTPIETALLGASPLVVTSTQPSNESLDVGIDSQVTVTFNRPVVPLSGVDAQEALPQPLVFEPPLDGDGTWLTTSIYSFQPTLGLAGSTQYWVTVQPLTAMSGESMQEPWSFTFATAEPMVVDATPQGELVSPDSVVTIHFSQPMDRESTEAAFALSNLTQEDALVEGEFGWDAASRRLTYTPTVALDFGNEYEIWLDDSAQPASQQGTLRDSLERNFTVVPLPAVTSTTPEDGATGVAPDASVLIRFSAPMSGTLLLPEVTIAPLLTSTDVYSYYYDYDSELRLEWNKEPNTTYSITVGGDAQDLYGNTIGKDTTFSFTTGDFAPYIHLELDNYTHFTPITTTYASVLYRNVDGVEVSLYRLPLEDFISDFNGDNSWEAWQSYEVPDAEENLVWTRTYTTTDVRNEIFQRVISLDDGNGEPLAPGLYMVEVPLVQPAEGEQAYGNADTPDRQRAILVMSHSGLVVKKSYGGDSLAWLTDIVTTEPLEQRTVQFYAAGEPLEDAVTDADGIALAQLELSPQTTWLPVVAYVSEPGDDEFAIATSDWSSGIAPYDFNVSGGYASEEWQSVFYTERPIYRPGQTVYWKGIVRQLEEDAFVLPDASRSMTITVRNDRGDTVSEQNIPFTEFGTLFGEVQLAPDATTGYYYIEARMDIRPDYTFYGGVSFQVASYRKPEFEVAVASSQPEYVQGDTVKVTVEADYFSGGPLADAPLTWRVIAEPYTFDWEDAPEGQWYSFTPFDPSGEEYDPYASMMMMGLVKEGTGRTDADGTFVLELPADLGESLQSQRWMVDATVQSPTNQFVSESTSFPVHRAEFYVGLSPQSNVLVAGEPGTVDLIALTPDGEAVAGADFVVTAWEYKWSSVQEQGPDGRYMWKSSAERTAVVSETVRSGRDGMAAFTWTPPAGGQYQISAVGSDDVGNPVNSAVFQWVSDETPGGYVSWRRENNDRIELVADKRVYEPGDTARILIPNPFQGEVAALVTVERSGVVEEYVYVLEGSSDTFELPITEEHIPNIFVAVTLLKGIDKTNPAPAIRVGLVQLNVDTAAKELTIEVENNRTLAGDMAPARPGETITWTLTILDSQGSPVPDAEVSVGIVDKALFSLAESNLQPLVDSFYRIRPLGVSTGATLIINRDRISQQLSEGSKGGGGGDGGGGIEVREEFPDTAFWHADFVSDDEGRIVFTQVLPDNLTTWRLSARGVTQDTRVGDADSDLIVSKELQVRPLLPRFFTAGDRAIIGGLVINTTEDQSAQGTFTIEVQGATLEGDAEFDFQLEPGEDELFSAPISIPNDTDSVTVTMTADGGELSDALRISLPVRLYQTPETVATSGEVPIEGLTEAISIPTEATDDGELVVGVEASLAAGMLDGLTYLEHYLWECNEQTVSRFLPNLFTVRAMRSLGIDDSELESDLAYQLGVGVQMLVSRQNGDGGWGYWPSEESNPFVTSYVLWGLANALGMDFAVPDHTINRAVDYLDRSFVAPDDVEESWMLNEMAFTHFVLAEMGESDPGRMSTLYDVRERLGHYGQAYLAMALWDDDPNDPRVQTLLDDLAGSVNLTATSAWWQEENVDWFTLNTDVRTTAVALDAFSRIRPADSFLPNVVRWLMEQRDTGVWSTTQENAWSIISLTDWMVASGELEADYDWMVELNGAEMGSGSFDQSSLRDSVEMRAAVADMLRDEANLLHFSRSDDPGRMVYTTHLEYFMDALAIEALDRGIVVDRTFSVDGEPVGSAEVGDVISVTVTVVAPTDLHHLSVDVAIPAGTELIDPNLDSSPQYDEFGNPIAYSSGDTWWPTYRDYRDDRVAFFDTELPAGTYQTHFLLRATLPGEFRVLPAHAELMYFPEVWGRSSGSVFTVSE